MPPYRPTRVLRHWLLGVGVAGLGVLLSVFLAYRQLLSSEQIDRDRLTQAAQVASGAIIRHIDGFAEIAFGLRNLFVVDPLVSRKAFTQAVEGLDLKTRHPGITNIAFTRYVKAHQKASFEDHVRRDISLDARGYPEFSIHPPGDRAEYFVADYLWPVSGNQGVHGLDISAQPMNLASMRFAQTTGKPTASGPFDLIRVLSPCWHPFRRRASIGAASHGMPVSNGGVDDPFFGCCLDTTDSNRGPGGSAPPMPRNGRALPKEQRTTSAWQRALILDHARYEPLACRSTAYAAFAFFATACASARISGLRTTTRSGCAKCTNCRRICSIASQVEPGFAFST